MVNFIRVDGTRRYFGRKKPLVVTPRLSLKNYMLKSIPAPPATCAYMAKAREAIHRMYMNDTLGCCVEAEIGHSIGVFTFNANDGYIFNNNQIINMYSAMAGYVRGEPSTDQGTDIGTALSVWQQSGAPPGAHRIAGSLAIDASNPEEYRTAIWLFGNLMLGLDLPDAWVAPFPSGNGFTWDVAGAPDPSNGHCIGAYGYESAAGNVSIATWGMNGFMTDAALAEYCSVSNGGELYSVISKDSLKAAQQLAPNGFDWTQLVADFEALGGDVQGA